MEYTRTNMPPHLKTALTDIEKQFIALRANGCSIRDIAKTLKKSTSTVCEWNKKFFRDILSQRNKAFCELQKKVIDLKNSRIDFLKKEIGRITSVLEKFDVTDNDVFSGYDKIFNRFERLSNLLSVYENEVLSIGVNFKDNIEPETEIDTDETSSGNGGNGVSENSVTETAEKPDVNTNRKQNCNSTTFPEQHDDEKTMT